MKKISFLYCKQVDIYIEEQYIIWENVYVIKRYSIILHQCKFEFEFESCKKAEKVKFNRHAESIIEQLHLRQVFKKILKIKKSCSLDQLKVATVKIFLTNPVFISITMLIKIVKKSLKLHFYSGE